MKSKIYSFEKTNLKIPIFSRYSVVFERVVGVRGLEPRAPASQTRCATNCATPRKSSKSILLFYENRQEKSILFAIT